MAEQDRAAAAIHDVSFFEFGSGTYTLELVIFMTELSLLFS